MCEEAQLGVVAVNTVAPSNSANSNASKYRLLRVSASKHPYMLFVRRLITPAILVTAEPENSGAGGLIWPSLGKLLLSLAMFINVCHFRGYCQPG